MGPAAKEILIIKNITREGPGILGELIKKNGIQSRIIDLSRGETINYSGQFAAVVVLGGPDSANDENIKMTSELELIRNVLDSGISFLGICLGLQTLVKAAGGKVIESPVKEIGFREKDGQFFRIELTEDGRKDPLFEGIDDSFNVFHLHGETVILSDNLKLLATGQSCNNQIVKAGSKSYGIQCHFELTEEMFEKWISEDPDLLKLDTEMLRSDFFTLKDKYCNTGKLLFTNFLRMAGFNV
jgi:GMP synthase (glutamine-hydrolysing)